MAASDCNTSQGAPEIVFFDLETTVPKAAGAKFWVLEFGAVVVCPRKLAEIESFSTLIRPEDLSVVALRSSRPDGITREAVSTAPVFKEVAEKIYTILNGRIWAGHNIQRFDCVRIKEAFAELDRPAPQPVGLIDSLGVLTQKFGRRAGNMKMATLADYFGLGQQKHRSLDDARMSLEVVKHCATVLFLESSQPSLFFQRWKDGYSTITTRSRSNQKLSREENSRKAPPTSHIHQRAVPYARASFEQQVTEQVTSLFCGISGNQPLNQLLCHSRSVLR
ncbi:hypothetical protein Droror1_Dr00028004 [Drosera rotundifolia]